MSIPHDVLYTLTPIESVPTRDELVRVFPEPVESLRALALDASNDFGVRLRAVRALPLFCPQTCSGAEAHLALRAALGQFNTAPQAGKNLLLLRAAIEALGVARSGDESDVDVLIPFLDSANRDLRAATARALRDTCNTRAIVPLRARYQVEAIPQVRIAISSALRDLGTCT